MGRHHQIQHPLEMATLNPQPAIAILYFHLPRLELLARQPNLIYQARPRRGTSELGVQLCIIPVQAQSILYLEYLRECLVH